MKKFLGSAWFAFLTTLVLAGATVAAFVFLKPMGNGIDNFTIKEIFSKYVGWAAGPVAALVSLLLIFILNGIRRIIRLRRVSLLHPIVILLGLLPWVALSWDLVMVEERNTQIANAIIDFVGRELFLGCAAAIVFVLVCSIPLLLPKRR